MRFSICGGTALVHDTEFGADFVPTDIALLGTRIASVNASQMGDAERGSIVFDADGLLVLPGIVDLHGEAFGHRSLSSADGLAYDGGLVDVDRQLIESGITTACHALAYSWEADLAGHETAAAILHQIAVQRHALRADHRVHLQFEIHHIDGVYDVLNWIGQKRIDFLSFHDHLPLILATLDDPKKHAALAARAGCNGDAYNGRVKKAVDQESEVERALGTLAQACRVRGIPLASHDDISCFDRERYHAMGAALSEFPRTQDALFAALALDSRVIMSASNVLLEGIQNNGLAAIDAVRSNMCDILVSDYYYPALLHAPFKLAHQNACSLADAWRLVSDHPAAALGATERGRLAPGYRADLIMVEAAADGKVRLVATVAAGRLVHCAEPERMLAQQAYSMAA